MLVGIDPDDEGPDNANSVLLNPGDGPTEVSPLLQVELLANGYQPFHGRGFETNE
jgi:hypothetical protein